ncbi:MAG TPA: hypothetical protein VFJ80_13630 [Candidatus Limnocylindrales bacterium]|jgi:hypothetical protein|nr:hypothetical protein [Candidatus Limnocylindrales bacterium]
MAKRLRGSTSRPGQRPPLQRRSIAGARPASPTTRPPSTALTPGEEARAGDLEARIVAAERANEEPVRTRRERIASVSDEVGRVRTGSIAIRAAEEYGYVSRDVRRIGAIGGSLLAILIGLWVVVQATGIGPR